MRYLSSIAATLMLCACAAGSQTLDTESAGPATPRLMDPQACEALKNTVIGQTTANAMMEATKAKVRVVVGSVDGAARPMTMDYRPDRLVVDVRDGKVHAGRCG